MNRIINYLVDAIGGVLFYFGQTKLRTALTLMGITVGVSSIIAIMTVLETFEQSTESLVADMKTNIFYITKDNPVQVQFGNDAGWGKRKIPRITWDEYEQLKRNLSLVTNMAATTTEEPSDRTISVGKEELKSRLASFWGSDGDVLSVSKYDILDGRNIQDVDIENASRVAIVGYYIKEQLFPYSNPVGQNIEIDNIPFEIIALTEPKGELLGQNMDSMIGIPISTYLKYYGGKGWRGRPDLQLILEAESMDTLEDATDEAIGVFRAIRKIPPGEPNNFYIATNDQLMDTFGSFTSSIKIFVGLVAGISLIVAGIGSANIMLVSLTERIKEIGIRKALGAPPSSIKLIIVLESVFVTAISGYVGLLLGGAVLNSFDLEDYWITDPGVSTSLVIGATFTLILAGLIAAYVPANRAASIKPIVALRDE